MLGFDWASAHCQNTLIPDTAKPKAGLKDPPYTSLSNRYVLRKYHFPSLLSSVMALTKSFQGRRVQ